MALRIIDGGRDGSTVEFRLPPEVNADEAWLAGEFNDWSTDATPLVRASDGSFAAQVTLEPGRSYRFRYFLGGERWENDWAADRYEDNGHGGHDSVVDVPARSEQPDEPDPPAAAPADGTRTRKANVDPPARARGQSAAAERADEGSAPPPPAKPKRRVAKKAKA